MSQNITFVKDFTKLVGFETLWRIYLENNNVHISRESQNIIVNLITVISKFEENSNSFNFIFDKIFSNLYNNYEILQGFKNEFIKLNELVEIENLSVKVTIFLISRTK